MLQLRLSLTPSPCTGLGRREAQKAKITVQIRARNSSEIRKQREVNDSHVKCSENPFSLEETPFPLPSAVMGGDTE